MSASERLRALDEAMTPGPWRTKRWPHEPTHLVTDDIERPNYVKYTRPARDFPLVADLRNALPLIADVVEAAESEALGDIFDDTTMYPAQKRLAAALTALREHLEGQ